MSRTVRIRLRRAGVFVCLILLAYSALIRNLHAQQGQPSKTTSWLQPSGSPIFVVAPSLAIGYAPTSLTSGYLANSANLDIVTADYASGRITVFVGKGNGSFAPGVAYAAGAQPSSLALADLNGDGNLDVVAANESDATVSILPGNGDGSLGARKTVAVGFKPYFVVVGDFTGNGYSDIAVAGRTGTTLAVLENDGLGNFAKPLNFALAQTPSTITAADFNHDGHLDLAVANPDGTVNLWLGKGNGQFTTAAPVVTGSSALSSITAADLNRDGKMDLIVTSLLDDSMQVLLGNGDGTFALGSVLKPGNSPVSSYVADVNGDGVPDLVVVNKGSNSFSVLNGLGDGTFSPAVEFVVGNGPLGAAVGSFYGNSHADIATIDNAANALSMPAGHGDGTFGAARAYAAGDQPVALASADLSGNGSGDLAVASYCDSAACSGSGDVAILLAGAGGVYGLSAVYPMGAGSVSVALMDVNGDGKPDLITVNRADKTLSLRLGAGGGAFGALNTISLSGAPSALAFGDFNGDGKRDVAILEDCGSATCAQTAQVEILEGTGSGVFQTEGLYPVGYSPVGVASGATRSGGATDLVIANRCGADASCKSGGTATILLGDGKGRFVNGADVPLSNNLSAIALADLRGSGVLDLVVAGSADNAVSVFPGTGTGTFKTATSYTVGNAPVALAIADFNGDGKQDVAVANAADSTVTVLYGTGTGTLEPAVPLAVSSNPTALTAIPGPAHTAASLATVNGVSSGTSSVPRLTVVSNVQAIPAAGTNPTTLTLTIGPPASTTVNSSTAVAISFSVVGVAATGTPGGTVTITGNDSALTVFCTGTLAAGSTAGTGTYSCSTPLLNGGVTMLTASYQGDANYAANSTTAGVTVTPLTPTITVADNPSTQTTVNTSVSFTASLTGVTLTPVTPKGTMTFSLNGTPVSGCAMPVSTSGQLPCTISSMTVGANSISAAYTGDPSFVQGTAGSVSHSVVAATPTITISPSVPSSSVNTSVTFTASLTGATLTPVVPNGTMAFALNGTPIASAGCGGTVTGSGTSQCAIANMPAGSNTITATYSGDTNFVPASPGSVPYSVGALTPTVSITPSVASSSVNTAVTFTASLAGATLTPVVPKGTMTFALNGTPITAAGCGGAVSASGTSQCTIGNMPAGSNAVTATYSGDTNFVPASPGSLPYTVSALTPTISIAPSAASSSVNTAVTFTASLAGATLTPVVPNGTMTFALNGAPITAAGCGGAVSASGTSQCTIGNMPAGSNAVTATYSGDTNFVPASPGSLPYPVSALTPTIGISPSVASSSVNAAVTFIASLTGTPLTPVVPKGTMTFALNGTPITAAGCGGTVSASGTSQCSIANMPAGSNSVTATYSGDTNFVPAAPGSLPYTVSALTPTISISPSVASSSVNTSVTFTASLVGVTLTPVAPNGTMVFALNGTPITAAGCGGAVSAAGTAQCAISNMAAGSNTVTATYSGDINFVPSSPGSVPYSVSTVSPTFAVTPAPSTPAQVTAGGTVTFYAQLGGNPFTPITPKGTVAFSLNGGAVSTCPTQSVSLISGVWTAQCAISSLPAGNDNVTAAYSNDANFIVATPASYLQNVIQAVPTLSLTSSPSQTTFVNHPTSFTATVAVPTGQTGAPIPSGNVTFKQGTNVLCGGPQGLSVPTLPLSPTNQPTASCNNVAFSSVSASLPIVAAYSGDGNFTAGNQPTINLTVATGSTKTTFSTSGSTVVNGTVTVATTVAPADSGTAVPQGTVTFTSNATPVPTGTCMNGVTLAADGSVPPCTLIFGAAAVDSITATFNPVASGNFATSNVTGALTIGQGAAPIVLATNVAGPTVNQQVTLTATFTPAITGTLPTGSITFVDAATSQALCTAAFAPAVTCQPSFSSVGPHSITASLSKDQNFAASTSNPIVESVVQAGTTTTVVAAFANSSVNEQVQFTATVAANAAGTTAPTGSVTFNAALGAQTLVLCGGSKSLSPVAGLPTATCTDLFPTKGNWTVTATYSGDANFTAGTSAGITQSVGKTAVSLAGIAPTITSQVNGNVTYTATITSTISGTTIPTGTVTFGDGTTALCGSGVTVAPSGTAGTVSASCQESFAVAGNHNITATYSGDGNFAGSTINSVVSVGATSTSVTVASSTPTSKATQSVIFTAVVTPTMKGTTAPSGTVTFTSSDGTLNAMCGAVTVSQHADGTSIANCPATFPHNTALPGQITVNAAYSSDLNTNGVINFGSNSATTAQTVQDFTARTTVTPTGGSSDPSSSKGVVLTEGYGTAADTTTSPPVAPDPFNSAAITVTIASTGSFNDSLNAACSIVSNTTKAPVTDPSCKLSNSTPSGVNGTTLTYTIAASAKAPVDSYSVTVVFTDSALSTLSQTTAPLTVDVVGQSASLALGTGGATGNEGALFFTPTPFSGTPNISCPQIWDTVNLKVLSNAGGSLLGCTGPSGTISVNGFVTTVPISISTKSSSAMLIHSGNGLYLAGIFGVPFLALVGVICGAGSRTRRMLRYFSLIVLGAGTLCATGCGGSFSRPPTPTTSGIAAGNYLVQVLATDSSGNTYYAEVPLVVNAQ